MPETSLEQLMKPTRLQTQLLELALKGKLVLPAKTHPRSRRIIRNCRTEPKRNALEMASTAAIRGAIEIEAINRSDIFHKTEGSCYLCGRNISENTFHIDHVIPVYYGGTHTWNNLMPACKDCNVAKGARTVAVEVDSGNAYVF